MRNFSWDDIPRLDLPGLFLISQFIDSLFHVDKVDLLIPVSEDKTALNRLTNILKECL